MLWGWYFESLPGKRSLLIQLVQITLTVLSKKKPSVSSRQVYLGKAIRETLKGLEVTVGNSSYSQ